MADQALLALLVLDLALLLFAVWRPWAGLVLLLVGSPFNGFLANVVSRELFLGDVLSIALSAWHDAVLLGIVIAAGLAFLRSRQRPTTVEFLVFAVLLLGLFYLAVSPFLVAAAYSYRILYEPVALLGAILILARTDGLPEWLPRRAGLAIVGGAVLAALFTWWQVYVGGFMYLDLHYHDAGGTLASAYSATFVHQPRGIGTFQGPNEFGAYLAIATVLLVVPGVLRLPLWVRSWALAAIGLALLLSFSRSGWLSTGVGVAIGLLLSRPQLPDRDRLWATIRSRRFLAQAVPPLVAAVTLTVLVFTSSGAPSYVGGTVTGTEPSAGGRPQSTAAGVRRVALHPFGQGLGTAGPKSTRFEGEGAAPPFNSETWDLNYAVQVGLPGVALTGALIAVIGAALWRGRRHPWARAAAAAGVGLGTAALFIPIVDDPSVAVPLWALAGIGLAIAARNGSLDQVAGSVTPQAPPGAA